MNPDVISDLVQILGTVDATFAPTRERGGNLRTNAMLARRDFREQGVQYHAGGDAARRKSAERRLSAMEDAGLVAVFRRQGRARGVRLTPVGEDTARRIAGLPDLSESLEVMAIVAKNHLEREPKLLTDLWAAEADVVGVPWGGETKAYVILEEELLPAMVAGLMVCNTTIPGHAYYAVTPAGWAALDDGFPTPAGAGAFAQAARDEYFEAFRLARVGYADAKVAALGEIGPLPLPVSVGGSPIGPHGLGV
ncbi:hypothetical protein [Limnoglobus roseus]|nr:hypothetical protein [Limnoglobus roseus]